MREVREMIERRVYKRYKSDLEVEYTVNDTVEIKSRTRTVNVSEGGVCMPLNKAVRQGKKILMKIRMPTRDGEITALGKVVWKTPYEHNLADEEDAGIKFLGMYENGVNVLSKYIQSLS